MSTHTPEIAPDPEHGGVRLYFSYNLYLKIKPEILAIPGAKYRQAPEPHWHVPAYPGNAALVAGLSTKYGFVYANGAQSALAAESPAALNRIATGVDGAIELEFDRADPIISAVQKLPRRFFFFAPRPHWNVPLVLENAESLFAILKRDFVLDDRAQAAIAALRAEWEALPKTMGVWLEDALIHVVLPLHSILETAITRLPGAKRTRKRGEWTMPVTPQTWEQLQKLMVQAGAVASPATVAAIESAVATYRANVAASAASSGDMDFAQIGGTPRPFQRAGVAYAVQHKRVLIGDQQGLGKTVQGMLWLHALGAFPAVIFAPPSLVANWHEELKKWLPQYSISRLKGTKAKPGDYDADIILCSYSIAWPRMQHGMAAELDRRGCNAFVCDESHYLKNSAKDKHRTYKTQRVRAIYEFAQGREYRLLLSGTPITNKPIEFAAQLDILGVLDLFGGFTRFSREFGGAFQGAFGMQYGKVPSQKLQELNEILRGHCYVRREKKDVLGELPAKQRALVYFDLDNAKEYFKAKADVVQFIMDQVEQDRAFKEAIAFYDEETQDALIKERKQEKSYAARNAEALVRLNVLKRLAVKGKLAGVVEWLTDFIESGEKIVVFAHHRDVQRQLIDTFEPMGAVRLIADDSSEVQQWNKQQFQENPDCPMIICSDEVGREGHTLTAASNVAFVELAWTPTAMEQCEDRIHRIGQQNAVTAWYLLASGSIDMDIYDIIEGKRAQVEAATSGVITESETGSVVKDVIKRMTGA